MSVRNNAEKAHQSESKPITWRRALICWAGFVVLGVLGTLISLRMDSGLLTWISGGLLLVSLAGSASLALLNRWVELDTYHWPPDRRNGVEAWLVSIPVAVGIFSASFLIAGLISNNGSGSANVSTSTSGDPVFWIGTSALATIATAVVAMLTLFATRADSRSRTRPIMSCDLLPVVLAHGTAELVLTNLGSSAAFNVVVSFSPDLPPITKSEDPTSLIPFLRERYAKALPTFAPGRRLTNVYWIPEFNQSPTPSDAPPREITAIFEYEDASGYRYKDRYPLTVEMLFNQTTPSPSGDVHTYPKRAVKALEALAQHRNQQ